MFIEDSGSKFWDSLDAALRKIRNRADGSARKIVKYFILFSITYCVLILFQSFRGFENILATDRATHGVDNYSIPNAGIDAVQRQVDDTIGAAAADRTADIPGTTDNATAAIPAPTPAPVPAACTTSSPVTNLE